MREIKRKSISIAVVILMIISSFANTIFAGEESEAAIEISTADQMIDLLMNGGDEALIKNYALSDDIDMKDATKPMKSIGYRNSMYKSKGFAGKFDGRGHKIENLDIKGPALFTKVEKTGKIINLTIQNSKITSNSIDACPAGLVSINEGVIEGCYSIDGNVSSVKDNKAGGLVGENKGSILRSAVVGGRVFEDDNFDRFVGGFVGSNSGDIDQCFSSADVEGQKSIGGFVGEHAKGTIKNSYSTGKVTARGGEAGGFVGGFKSSAVIENSYASNDVIGSDGGGFSGWSGSSFGSLGTAKNVYFNSDRQRPENEGKTPLKNGVSKKSLEEMKSGEFLLQLAAGQVDVWTQRNGEIPSLVNTHVADKTESQDDKQVEFAIVDYDKKEYRFKLIKKFNIKIGESDILIDVMKKASDEGKMIFTEEDGSYGKFIKSIEGLDAASPSGWMFNVNDKLSNMGVSSTNIKDKDKVLWFYGDALNNYCGPMWQDIEKPAEEYIEIGNKEELKRYLGGGNVDSLKQNYRLTADIDLQGTDFEPIGTREKPFTGKFDGQNFRIKNLQINKGKEDKGIGFFGALNGAEVKNLTIENADVTGGSVIGVLAGESQADIEGGVFTLIGNCHVSGRLRATGENFIKQTDAGGLIGINQGGYNKDTQNMAYSVVDRSSANVEVIGDLNGEDKGIAGHIGGLVGWNKGNIKGSSANGSVEGGNTTGGFVGSNWGQVFDSKATGDVKGHFTVGGFVGTSNDGSLIKDSYSTGNVTAVSKDSSENIGGFAGSISGRAECCVSSGVVSRGWSYSGGFAGKIESSISGPSQFVAIKECFGNTIDVNGDNLKSFGNFIAKKDDKAFNDAAESIGVNQKLAIDKINKIFNAKIDNSLNIEKEKAISEVGKEMSIELVNESLYQEIDKIIKEYKSSVYKSKNSEQLKAAKDIAIDKIEKIRHKDKEITAKRLSAEAVDNLIEDIGKVTSENLIEKKEKVDRARRELDKLSEDEREYVTAVELLLRIEREVEDLIKALPVKSVTDVKGLARVTARFYGDVVLKVDDITESYGERKDNDTIAQNLSKFNKNKYDIRVYDISINGKYEGNAELDIYVGDDKNERNIQIVHLSNSGDAEKFVGAVAKGKFHIAPNGFSPFIVAVKKSTNSTNSDKTNVATKNRTAVKTSDDFKEYFWLALLGVASAAIIANKKRKNL